MKNTFKNYRQIKKLCPYTFTAGLPICERYRKDHSRLEKKRSGSNRNWDCPLAIPLGRWPYIQASSTSSFKENGMTNSHYLFSSEDIRKSVSYPWSFAGIILIPVLQLRVEDFCANDQNWNKTDFIFTRSSIGRVIRKLIKQYLKNMALWMFSLIYSANSKRSHSIRIDCCLKRFHLYGSSASVYRFPKCFANTQGIPTLRRISGYEN